MTTITLPAGAWTLAAIDFPLAIVAVPKSAKVHAYVAEVDTPDDTPSGAAPLAGILVSRSAGIFDRLYLRSDTEADTKITFGEWASLASEAAFIDADIGAARGPITAFSINDAKTIDGGDDAGAGADTIDGGTSPGAPPSNAFDGGTE